MQTLHPDDERLAALAGDRDATADIALIEHVRGCDRCRPIVDDLRLLTAALAELPDLAPSRPLRLIPPVPEPVARPAGAGGWLKRLVAPVMGTGAVLVLVGAIGTAGTLSAPAFTELATDQSAGAEGNRNSPEETQESAAAPGTVSASPRTDDSTTGALDGSASPLAEYEPPTGAAGGDLDFLTGPARTVSPALLVIGIVLLGVSIALRYFVEPRSG